MNDQAAIQADIWLTVCFVAWTIAFGAYVLFALFCEDSRLWRQADRQYERERESERLKL